MYDELCTVDFAAERLKLHPKTVLRFIREGRLAATRMGKAYRIRRADIEALVAPSTAPEPPATEAWVTSIVDIPGIAPTAAAGFASRVTSALNARPAGGRPLRAEVIHEPQRNHLKLVLVGPPDETAGLLSLIRIWLDQPTA